MMNSVNALTGAKAVCPPPPSNTGVKQNCSERPQVTEAYSSAYSSAARSMALADINLSIKPYDVHYTDGIKCDPVSIPRTGVNPELVAKNMKFENVYVSPCDIHFTEDMDYIVVKEMSGEEVNKWWHDEMDYDNPPYLPKSQVKQIELKKDTVFSRVYDGENSGMYGGWVMKPQDIEGLTPEEIQDKFALPQKPIKMCDVTLPKGTNLRTGLCNPLEGWGKGGGVQFDLMGQKVGEFGNERDIPIPKKEQTTEPEM